MANFSYICLALMVVLALPPTPGAQTTDLLPDLIVRQNDLYDHDYVSDGDRLWLRVSNGTANIGDGRLMLFGDRNAATDSLLPIKQRISRSDGTAYDRLSGQFIFHPQHDHIHVDDWAVFRIREILPGDEVGPVVVNGPKQSYCVFDDDIYDNTLPNFTPSGEFFTCFANVQGLSVGWLDVYTKDLPGQQIDITDVPDGVYWLESVVDPENRILETNDDNNVERIRIVIGNPTSLPPDRFEPNDSVPQVLSRPVGGPNSPRLGPCDPETVITGTIHSATDRDLFAIFVVGDGGSSGFLHLQYDRRQADLDLELLDSTGTRIRQSAGNDDEESISLTGLAPGWYYAGVYPYLDDLSPEYTLTIEPPTTAVPPTIAFVEDPVADTALHGVETYRLEWEYRDPAGLPGWVSVAVNKSPEFDGNEIWLPTSLNTDADLGFYQINSAYLDFDSYWIYLEASNGGSRSGVWSSGTVTFIEAGNSGDLAGHLIDRYDNPISGAYVTTVVPAAEDSSTGSGAFLLSNLAPTRIDIEIRHPEYHDTVVTDIRVLSDTTVSRPIVLWEICDLAIGDIAPPSDTIDINDALMLIDYLWADSTSVVPDSVLGNIDGSVDGAITLMDLNALVLYLFRSGAPPVCPTYSP